MTETSHCNGVGCCNTVIDSTSKPRLSSSSANELLLDFLAKSTEFRVHTGNVGTWGELKLKTFQNMSEELIECLRLQLRDWQPDLSQFQNGKVDFK